mmetsp:Transcript_7847/g.6943  ORF Transcript_7847/g.6943 Transcript_7847/m.6943 type:complete len:107 (-) Transcript_7847:319-639(-)
MVEQSMDSVSDSGEVRINYIKGKFKDIIDNLITLEMKSFYSLMKAGPIKAILKKAKTNKRHSKYYEKVYDNAAEIFLDCKLSEPVINIMEENSARSFKYAKNLKKM